MSQGDVASTLGAAQGVRDADLPWLTLTEERLLVDLALAQLKAHGLDESVLHDEEINLAAQEEADDSGEVRILQSIPLTR